VLLVRDSIYVWCRAFVFIFEGIGIFDEVTYTIAIMFAGFVCGPLTIGPAGNLLVMAAISIYCFCVLPYKDDPEEAKIERRLNMFLNSRWRRHITKLQKRLAVQQVSSMVTKDSIIEKKESVPVEAPGSLQVSKQVPLAEHFQKVLQEVAEDVETVQQPIGKLSTETLGMRYCDLEEDSQLIEAERRYKAKRLPTKKIGAEVVQVLIKPGDIIEPGQIVVEVKDRAPDDGYPDKETIFKALDVDRSGALDKGEVADVLVSWGVPRMESEMIFDQLDGKHNSDDTLGRVTEEEFYDEWEPIWRYQVKAVEAAINKYKRFSENGLKREEAEKTKATKRWDKAALVVDMSDEAADFAAAAAPATKKKASLADAADTHMKVAGFQRTMTTNAEDQEDWDATIKNTKLAYRVTDESALEAHDVWDIMYAHFGCNCLPGFGKVQILSYVLHIASAAFDCAVPCRRGQAVLGRKGWSSRSRLVPRVARDLRCHAAALCAGAGAGGTFQCGRGLPASVLPVGLPVPPPLPG